MNLTPWPFSLIESWEKTIEIRLNDEKRSLLNIWDTIIFTNTEDNNRKITTTIIGLIKYSSFMDLFENLDIWLFWSKNKEELISLVYKFYSKENESKYWVLWIHIKKKGF